MTKIDGREPMVFEQDVLDSPWSRSGLVRFRRPQRHDRIGTAAEQRW